MLKDLVIKNFQSHKITSLKFHEGVTAIVGPSDCGKSAIIRALRWVLFNDQPGEAYRRHNTDSTGVTISIGDEDYTRLRSNKDNKYYIGDDPDESKFDKVKNDVPEELSKIFNMDDINVQKQMDAPFLLSENPPEVGRVLNRAAGIDDIDKCMSRINSMKLENGKELTIRNKDHADLDIELAKYRRLSDIDAQVSAAEKLDAMLKKNRSQISGIESALDGLDEVEEKIEKLDPLASISLDEAVSLQDELKTTERQIRDLSDDLDLLEGIGVKLSKISVEPIETSLQEALKASDVLIDAEKVVDSLEGVLDDIENSGEDYTDKKKRLAELEKEFEELMPDTCPLCEQEV